MAISIKHGKMLIKRKCLLGKLSFTDNQNTNLKMLNQNGLYLNVSQQFLLQSNSMIGQSAWIKTVKTITK